MNMPMQYAALAALNDRGYLRRSAVFLKKNFQTLKDILKSIPALNFVIEPEYGFFACVDTSRVKASCQELTVALLKRKCAVYPSDGLGETDPISYLRLNFSTPHRKHFLWLKKALPEAIKEAETGIYRKVVCEFFESVGTKRSKRIVRQIKAIG
jgi:aspartate/methionine/tyrosine aminotransferase